MIPLWSHLTLCSFLGLGTELNRGAPNSEQQPTGSRPLPLRRGALLARSSEPSMRSVSSLHPEGQGGHGRPEPPAGPGQSWGPRQQSPARRGQERWLQPWHPGHLPYPSKYGDAVGPGCEFLEVPGLSSAL